MNPRGVNRTAHRNGTTTQVNQESGEIPQTARIEIPQFPQAYVQTHRYRSANEHTTQTTHQRGAEDPALQNLG